MSGHSKRRRYAFARRQKEMQERRRPERPVTLEACVCGQHFDCPDGWHYGDDLPCSCTPDCALEATA